MDINNVTIVGRLTRDPDFQMLQGDKPLCKFSVAVNEMKDRVNYFDITTWNKTAENCSKFLKKGGQVAISGKLTQSRFEDKQGQKRSKVEIMALQVQFIGAKSDSQPNGSQNIDSQGISFSEVPPETIGDDEVPF
jgi:single-strand DNA-binding protein